MAASRFFHSIRRPRVRSRRTIPPNRKNLLKLLAKHVVAPFEHVTQLTAIVVALNGPPPDNDEEPLSNPCHPACAKHAESDYCRESWQLHVAEAQRRPEAHWHMCEFGMYCAMIPVAHEGNCLAAVKLACTASLSEDEFDRHVSLLDLLVEGFVVLHADFLCRLSSPLRDRAESGSVPIDGSEAIAPLRITHPQVEQAIRHIKTSFRDSSLTVAGVARHLGMHVNYLCHLFSAQTGLRMSRFITNQRIDLAKTLLATTNHQIKRIAHDAGYAHPNWFSHMFTLHTGMTPEKYRRGVRFKASDR